MTMHGHQTDIILLDIVKAFYTVPHNTLRQKLIWYLSITGHTHNRNQRVLIDNTSSEYTAAISAVLQGTVPGPCCTKK